MELAMGLGMGLGDPQADYASIAAVGLFVALMCVCTIVGHLLEEFPWAGHCCGDLDGVEREALARTGVQFQVKKKQFFRNFMTITLFGVVETLISFTIISLGALGLISRLNIGALELGDYLALGAVFSATDSACTLQALNQDERAYTTRAPSQLHV